MAGVASRTTGEPALTRYGKLLLLLATMAAPPAAAIAVYGLGPALPQAFSVTGVMGNVGEWEVTAALERRGETREFGGQMKVTHIGWCSQDGPLEKTGELSVRLARLSSSIAAQMRLDGEACEYSGTLADAYIGKLACPGRRPVRLLLWMR